MHRRLSCGRWHRLAGKGLLAAPRAGMPTAWQLAWSVTLTYPDAVIGGRLAARLHGLPLALDDVIDTYGPPGRQDNGLGRFRIATHAPSVRPNTLRLAGVFTVIEVEVAALDCLAQLSWDDALDLYAWLVTRDRLDRTRLCAGITNRLGRPGNTQLRRLLAFTRNGALSALERRLHLLLRRAGITGWTASVTIEDSHGVIGVVDLLFVAERLVIEADGMASHTGREVFERDRQRQNRLVNAGYRVLRFTWWDVTERPDLVVQQIHQALDPNH